jgi:hypothetical protein
MARDGSRVFQVMLAIGAVMALAIAVVALILASIDFGAIRSSETTVGTEILDGINVGRIGRDFLSLHSGGLFSFRLGLPTNPLQPLSNIFVMILRFMGFAMMWFRGIIVAFGLATPSDARIKTDVAIVDPDACLTNVGDLQVVSYKYTTEWAQQTGNDPDTVHVGLIADDVEKVIPDAVETSDNVMTGTVIEDFKTLDYHRLVPPVIGAIQALERRVRELEQAAA